MLDGFLSYSTVQQNCLRFYRTEPFSKIAVKKTGIVILISRVSNKDTDIQLDNDRLQNNIPANRIIRI